MPGKGQSQTEETKKKISEALKKSGGPVKTARSQQAQKLYKAYTESKSRTNGLKAEANSLLAMRKSLGRKKNTKAKRAQITAQIKAIREKQKAEAQRRRLLVEQAKAEKRVKKAQLVIEKSALRKSKLKDFRTKAKERLGKAKTPEGKQKILDAIARIEDNLLRQDSVVANAKSIIKQKGRSTTKKSNTTFDFEEHFDFFMEREYKPFRQLTVQEERADLEFLNEKFNEIEGELENGLIDETERQIAITTQKAEKAIEMGDILLTGAIVFGGFDTFYSKTNTAAKQAYQIGKDTAAQEMKIDSPPTSKENSQARVAETTQIADMYVQEMQNEARNATRNAIIAGATAGVAAVAIREKLKKIAAQMITGISGIIPGQYINRGRKQVFYENLLKITHFQRSEVLDSRTCNTCLTLDERIVKADDPFAHLEVVHTYCRGTWVPIFTVEEQPKAAKVGLPKNVRDSFASIDGRPVVNDFKQLKKPTNTKDNPEAKTEIEKRLKK